MDGPTSFTEEIGAIADGLREAPPSHPLLNRAAVRVDALGRRLHGIGYVRGEEIAYCLTEALRELDAAHPLPDEAREETVRRAALHLRAALDHAADGVLPPEPDVQSGSTEGVAERSVH